jgi:hypothetical protein
MEPGAQKAVTGVFAYARAHFYTLSPQKRVCAALVAHIGVSGAIDHTDESFLDDSIGAGSGAACAGTRLQSYIDGGSGKQVPITTGVGIGYGATLCMSLTCHFMKALTQHLVVKHNNGTHGRIRAGSSQTKTGGLKCMLHPMLIYLFLHARIVSG